MKTMKPSASEFVTLRGLRHHVRTWGSASAKVKAPRAPRLFLLHGWMDISASFQFLVDSFQQDWHVIALDWRGFGQSEQRNEPYWFPDYLGDLDVLLDHYSPDEPACLVGHSMGGNVACLYAGVRPQRVSKLITLEGFGMKESDPTLAPARVAKWLDQLKTTPSFRDYANRDEFIQRLLQDNPRLKPEQAVFLMENFSVENEDRNEEKQGSLEKRDKRLGYDADPYHKLTNPVPYHLDEAKVFWRAITAPVLWVAAQDSFIMKAFKGHEADYAARQACYRNLQTAMLEDSGHMMHHDQPQKLAALIEGFLLAQGSDSVSDPMSDTND